jgi:hypothetical protein
MPPVLVQHVHLEIDNTPKKFFISLYDGTSKEVQGLSVKWRNIEFFVVNCEDPESKLFFLRICDARYGAFFNQSPLVPEEKLSDIFESFVTTSLIKILKYADFDEEKYYKMSASFHEAASKAATVH